MSTKVTRIISRNGTEAEWAPDTGEEAMLAIGEFGYESDTNKLKIGHGTPDADGMVLWKDCDYIAGPVKGVVVSNNNIIELDENGELFALPYDDSEIKTELAIIEIEERILAARINKADIDILNLMISPVRHHNNLEIDGSELFKTAWGELHHHPGIKLKPLAEEGLQELDDGQSAAEVLRNFFNKIMGIDHEPIDLTQYTVLTAYPYKKGYVAEDGTDYGPYSLKLPTTEATYIDWGDGSDPVEGTITGTDLIHQYTPVDPNQSYVIKAIFNWNNNPNNIVTLNYSKVNRLNWLHDVVQFGSGSTLEDAQGAFAHYAGRFITALPSFNFTDHNDFTRVFANAYNFDQNVNSIFHSGVGRAYAMFNDAAQYKNGDTAIDFSKLSGVDYIAYMFANTAVTKTTLANLKGWDVSNVRDEPWNPGGGQVSYRGGMRKLFFLTHQFQVSSADTEFDLSDWHVTNLDPDANLEEEGIGSLKSITWNTNKLSQASHHEPFLPQFGTTLGGGVESIDIEDPTLGNDIEVSNQTFKATYTGGGTNPVYKWTTTNYASIVGDDDKEEAVVHFGWQDSTEMTEDSVVSVTITATENGVSQTLTEKVTVTTNKPAPNIVSVTPGSDDQQIMQTPMSWYATVVRADDSGPHNDPVVVSWTTTDSGANIIGADTPTPTITFSAAW